MRTSRLEHPTPGGSDASAKMSPDLADDLNRPAVKLLRSVEMRVEGRRDAADQEARVVRHRQRGVVEPDDAIGNQVLETGQRLQHGL